MFLYCKIPRIRTVENGVEQVTVLCAREGSRFTLLFEVLSMLLIELEMLINKIGKVIGVYPNRIRNIFNYCLGIAHSDTDLSKISTLGIY
jgi:transposase